MIIHVQIVLNRMMHHSIDSCMKNMLEQIRRRLVDTERRYKEMIVAMWYW